MCFASSLPGVGQTQLLQATSARASPPSQGKIPFQYPIQPCPLAMDGYPESSSSLLPIGVSGLDYVQHPQILLPGLLHLLMPSLD